MSQVTRQPSSADVDVWNAAPYVVAITREAIFSNRLDTDEGRNKAVDAIESGVEIKSTMGLMTRVVRLESLSSATTIPTLGVLVVQGSLMSEPMRLQLAQPEAAQPIFAKLRERLQEFPGGEWEVQTGKAGAGDVPFDPKLRIAIFLGLMAVAGVIAGAVEGAPDRGLIIGILLGWIGDLLGKIGSYIVAAIFLGGAIYITFNWIKNLPPKYFIQRAS